MLVNSRQTGKVQKKEEIPTISGYSWEKAALCPAKEGKPRTVSLFSDQFTASLFFQPRRAGMKALLTNPDVDACSAFPFHVKFPNGQTQQRTTSLCKLLGSSLWVPYFCCLPEWLARTLAASRLWILICKRNGVSISPKAALLTL